MSEDLPLGYLVSDQKLLEYGRNIIKDHPISDDDAISFAMFKVLYNAGANNSDAQWSSCAYFSPDKADVFLQISGGGAHSWRIAAEVERRLCEELDLQGPPVRFKPLDVDSSI